MTIPEPVLFMAGVLAFFVAVVALASWAERVRRRGIHAALAEAGGGARFDLDPGAKAQAFAHAGLWRELRRGAEGVRWAGHAMIDGVPVSILEHTYTTGSGKNRKTVRHTIASVPCPRDWAGLWLDEEHLLHKVADLFGKTDFRVEDEAFNRRWRVRVDDENFALAVLTPEAQTLLSSLPRGLSVRVGGGAVAVASRRSAQPKSVLELARAAAGFWRTLPPELRQSV